MSDLRRSEELLAHTEWLSRLARSLVREPADAEDAVQDTLVAALSSRGADVEQPRAWLARILTNFLRKRARGEERRRAREGMRERAASDAGPAEVVERAIAQQELIQAVIGLEEPYRSTLLQHYFEGLPAERIARREGTTAANVRQRLSRARQRLRSALQSRGAIERRNWTAGLALLASLARRRPSIVRPRVALAVGAGLALAVLVTATEATHVEGVGSLHMTIRAMANRFQMQPDSCASVYQSMRIAFETLNVAPGQNAADGSR